MSYKDLASELLNSMQSLHKARPHKHINEALQGEAFVLHFIAHHDHDVMPSEISQEMDVSSARIAFALNSLARKKLITRHINIKDRRKVIVKATEKGKELADTQYDAVIAAIVNLLKLLGESDAREYIRITDKLADIAQSIASNNT